MQDAAREAESDELQKPKGQEAVRQGKVDAESVALQKPETQEAVKQVQVDEESAQLQKPETQQVTNPVKCRTFTCASASKVQSSLAFQGEPAALCARTCFIAWNVHLSIVCTRSLVIAGRL